jgi:Ca2+-binding RTX toxin-like protein
LGVTVNLAAGTAQRGAELDSLVGIEEIDGTNYNDFITGNAGANFLGGLAGVDTLNGGDGNDTFAGGTGNDTMDGGTGSDTVTFQVSGSGVTLNLATDIATPGTETDRIVNIENAIGSNLADNLRGDTGINQLFGLCGNDTLNGDAGNDLLVGGAGKDTLVGGTGRDTLDSNLGDSGINTNADVISGFDAAGAALGDTIDLKDVYSGTLSFKGTGTIAGIGQIRLVNEGTATIVEINVSGTTAPDMEIRINDGAIKAANYLAGDFLL